MIAAAAIARDAADTFGLPAFNPAANKRGARYALLLGSEERLAGRVTLRDMEGGTQEMIAEAEGWW